jgi:hypothetical protein
MERFAPKRLRTCEVDDDARMCADRVLTNSGINCDNELLKFASASVVSDRSSTGVLLSDDGGEITDLLSVIKLNDL